jgi:adenine-specific DNA-methyltransferase
MTRFPTVQIGDATLILGDCLEVMETLGKVDAIVTDPPFFRVKPDGWDRQWSDKTGFYDWCDFIIGKMTDRLAGNGSLYWFAWAEHAAMIEARMRERLDVLNHIVWRKGAAGKSALGWMQKASKDSLRAFLPETERILFAAHYGADSFAMGASGYDAKCDELRGFLFEPLRAYLAEEVARSGWSREDLNREMGFAPRGMVETRYLGKSQWQLPTAPHYAKMRSLLNIGGDEYLKREYDDIKREYDDLKREYDDLKREYDDLRRPFNMRKGAQSTDVWDFDPVSGYAGKHPCEKPLALMTHILETSTSDAQTILDPFMGSGTTGVAALQLGRKFIGIELDTGYFDIACKRIEEAWRQPRLFEEPKRKPAPAPGLFDGDA